MTVESLDQRSDEALMSQVAVGDTAGLAVLVDRYRSRVFALLCRVTGRIDDAEDLFQETWIRVAKRAVTFDPARPFGPWIAKIATHIAIDWMRSARGRTAISGGPQDSETENVPSQDRTPIQTIEEKEKLKEVASALASLPERLREPVLLRYFHELTENEMVAKLGIAKGTVKSRLHNAIRALKEMLAEGQES